jgi:hypothetical protein
MNPFYQYVFSREDYDLLQDSILTKDILGSSSWKGEERILLYQDHIEHWLNGKLIKTYHLNDFEGFIVDNNAVLASSFRSILLFKKYQKLSFYEKWIVPIGLVKPRKSMFPDIYPDNLMAIFRQSIYFNIVFPKLGEFITGLSVILPEVSANIIRSRDLKNRWHGVIALILMAVGGFAVFRVSDLLIPNDPNKEITCNQRNWFENWLMGKETDPCNRLKN